MKFPNSSVKLKKEEANLPEAVCLVVLCVQYFGEKNVQQQRLNTNADLFLRMCDKIFSTQRSTYCISFFLSFQFQSHCLHQQTEVVLEVYLKL